MSNFIGMVFATLKKEGVDTSKMDINDAIAKYNEIKGKDGGGAENTAEKPSAEKQPASEPNATVSKKENVEALETVDKNKSNDAKTMKEQPAMSKQHQAKADYIKDKINNSWYANAKLDYGVEGQVKDVSISGNEMTITVEENGKTLTSKISYIDDYTPEQLYNIWQEFPDNSSDEKEASKLQNSMGVSPDEAEAFASGEGHLSKNGGYQGVSNVKDAPKFEYKGTSQNLWNGNMKPEDITPDYVRSLNDADCLRLLKWLNEAKK